MCIHIHVRPSVKWAFIRTSVFYLSLWPVWQNMLHHRDQFECYHLTSAAALTHSLSAKPVSSPTLVITQFRIHLRILLAHRFGTPIFCSKLDRISAAYLVASACLFFCFECCCWKSSRKDRGEGPSHLYSSHWLYCTKMADQGGGALKGLRLLTLERGPQGYGFHMYTNKVLKVNA